jgi:hypothetical protein
LLETLAALIDPLSDRPIDYALSLEVPNELIQDLNKRSGVTADALSEAGSALRDGKSLTEEQVALVVLASERAQAVLSYHGRQLAPTGRSAVILDT